MPEPLTKDNFDGVMTALGATINSHTETLAAQTTPLDAIKSDVAAMNTRLSNIEKLLRQGQRTEEIEQCIITLAKATGHKELAVPFFPAPGMASPAQE